MGLTPSGRDYSRLPEEELQRRYHQGDPAAFGELWARHEPELESRARRWSFGDEGIAREGLGRTKVKLLDPRIRAKYDPDRPWLPWASRVLHNEILDLHRKEGRIAAKPLEDDGPVAPQASDPQGFGIDIRDCLEKLPDLQRKVLILHFLDGMGTNEIAAELEIPNYTVSRLKMAALHNMRKCLSGEPMGGNTP